MHRDVQDKCQTCEVCARQKSAPKKNQAPLRTIVAGYPVQVVAVNILGPLPESTAGNPYIQAKLPIDLMHRTGESSEFPTKDYAVHLRKSLEEAFHQVHEQLSTSHERRKEHYDRHVHCEPYKEGDLVWLYSPVVQQGYPKKLHHPWTGPCRIVNKLSDSDYKIRGTWGRKTTGIFIYGIPTYMHI